MSKIPVSSDGFIDDDPDSTPLTSASTANSPREDSRTLAELAADVMEATSEPPQPPDGATDESQPPGEATASTNDEPPDEPPVEPPGTPLERRWAARIVAVLFLFAAGASCLTLSPAGGDPSGSSGPGTDAAASGSPGERSRTSLTEEEPFHAVFSEFSPIPSPSASPTPQPIVESTPTPVDPTPSPIVPAPTPVVPTPSSTPAPVPTETPTPPPTFHASLVSVADSFVQQDSPTENFGASDAMHVSGDKLEQFKRSFLLFDTSSIPAGSAIDNAELTLCFEHGPGGGAEGWVHELHLVNDDWAEAGVTWNNQPIVSEAISATIIVPASGSCVSYNVTADVESWVNAAANNGWRVNSEDEGAGGGNVRLATRDHPEGSIHPRLDLTYTLP